MVCLKRSKTQNTRYIYLETDDALKSHINAKHLLNKNENINLTEPGTVPNVQERTFVWKHALDFFLSYKFC